MKRFLMTLVIAAVFMATSAQAESGKPYVSGNFAFGIMTDSEAGPDTISFDPGWGIMGAVGYDMGQIRVEGEIAYRMFDLDEVTFPPAPPTSVDGDVTALSFMANGYYDFDIGGPLTPYIGAGLGLLDAEVEVSGGGSNSNTELAYQAMLGLGYDINPNLVLTAGYRFFGFTDSDGASVHELNVGARFMF